MAGNLKVRAMLALGYGCGLRAGEIVRLKAGDIDSAQMIIRVVQSKGRKDRHVMLPQGARYCHHQGEPTSKIFFPKLVSRAKQISCVLLQDSCHQRDRRCDPLQRQNAFFTACIGVRFEVKGGHEMDVLGPIP
jgi:site-specific recombinase XerD